LKVALQTKLIVNVTQGETLCVGELADRPLPRMRGLIGRRGLPAGEGLLLQPAPGIHTAFMRFPIDALFLDGGMRVLAIVERLGPWRVASRRRARAVLELAAGECSRCGVKVGDRLTLRDRKALPPASVRGEQPTPSHSDSVIWPGQHVQGGEPEAGDEPFERSHTRVLVVSRDRHFRSVTTMLLANRGCSVTATANLGRVVELASREGADVVVVDTGKVPGSAEGTVSAIGELGGSIGVVLVGEGVPSAGPRVTAFEKWAPFDDLFAAIERAGARRADAGGTR
jgi:uncharacterized membrane protein (UPF0127 family)